MKLRSLVFSVIALMVLVSWNLSAAELADVEAKQELILKKIDLMQSRKGIYVFGRGMFDYRFSTASGMAVNTNSPYIGDAPYIQADLTFEGRPYPFLKVGAGIRVKNNLEGFYGVGDVFEAREIYLETVMFRFIRLRMGDFSMALSPLTMIAPSDKNRYDATLFIKQREEALYDASLSDAEEWFLKGLAMDFGLGFSSGLSGRFIGFIPDDFKMKSYITRIDTAEASMAYDRYMFGGNAVLSGGDIVSLSANANAIADIKATRFAGSIQNLFDNLTYSVEGSLDLVKGILGSKGINKGLLARGEFAQSSTMTNELDAKRIDDYALVYGADIIFSGSKIFFNMIDVGNEFLSPAAQSWTYNQDGWNYLTAQGLSDNSFFRSYNDTLQIIRRWDRPFDLSQTMGVATPNRKGMEYGVTIKELKFIDVSGSMGSFEEIRPIGQANLRKFDVMTAGGRLSFNKLLKSWFMPVVTGSYKQETQTRTDDPSSVTNEMEDITSRIITAGIEFTPIKKLRVLGALSLISQKGKCFFDANNVNNTPLLVTTYVPYEVDFNTTVWSTGVFYELSKSTGLRFDFTSVDFMDKKISGKDYHFNLVNFNYVVNF